MLLIAVSVPAGTNTLQLISSVAETNKVCLVSPEIPRFIALNACLSDFPPISSNIPQVGTLATVSGENEYPLLDKTLEKLAKCESGGNPERINPNDMGSPSYGKYQFKEQTWITQLRKYGYFPEAEDKELMNFIFDEDIQDELARKMIENNGWKHWANCFEMLDLPRRY